MGSVGVERILDLISVGQNLNSMALEVESAELMRRAMEVLSVRSRVTKVDIAKIGSGELEELVLRLELVNARPVFVGVRTNEGDAIEAKARLRQSRGQVPTRLIFLGMGPDIPDNQIVGYYWNQFRKLNH